jgi:penicillin-binding protein 1C
MKRFLKYTILFFFFFIVLDWLFPFKVNPKYSQTIEAINGETIHAFLNVDDKWRLKMELSEMIPTLKKAFIAKEDRWFYYHCGFNPLSILRAGFQNIVFQKRTSGASTITMQVVRLLKPQRRTYFNKIIEIVRAVQLEWHFSKDEILQLYVNLVPYGSNIEGVKSASLIYFQKSPDRLSLAEATTLAIIPNRPNSLKIGQRNPFIFQERNKRLRIYGKYKVFTEDEVSNAISEPLTASRHSIPQFAPHLSLRLKKSLPNVTNIQSFLHFEKQRNIEEITQKYMERLRYLNIKNASVLVVNNETKTVEAYLGSSNFDDVESAGQVDGVKAVRSPGSTLKPLLYGLAFDNGIITPNSMMNDVPTNFGGYEPENFDQEFHGKISTTFALANSLNIPAVKILDQMGKQSMTSVLKKADFKIIQKTEKDLGLSLILGGCGVSLEELTALFSAFATNGEHSKLVFTKENQEKLSKTKLLSEEANYLMTDILSQVSRPDLPNNYSYTYRLPKIAWKTGTSYGKRDAWSIGYNKKYTVGIWIGNFTGEGVPELSGANTATPLLFEIFNTLEYGQKNEWFKPTKKLDQRFVCAESGDLPSVDCKNQVFDYYIPGVSHVRVCSHLKKVKVNQKEKITYCTRCLPADNYEEISIENLSPEIIGFYESKHIFYKKPFPHNPKCERIFDDSPPKITFPLDKAEYLIERAEANPIQLTVQVSNEVKEVFWYINNRFLKKNSPNESINFLPEAGINKISCTDDRGRTVHIKIKVKLI